MIDMLACPQCSHRFQLGAAMRDQIEADLRRDLKSETERQVDAAAASAQAEGKRLVEERDAELTRLRQDMDKLAVDHAAHLRRERELDEREAKVSIDIDTRVHEGLRTMRAQVEQAAEERYAQRLQEDLRVKDESMKILRAEVAKCSAKESDLLRREADLSRSRDNLELEKERALAEGRAKMREEVEQKVQATYDARLSDAVRDRDDELTQVRLRLQASRERESTLLQKEAELVDREDRLELRLKQTVLEEGRRIKDEVTARSQEEMRLVQEQHSLREREHTEQIAGLQEKLVELQRRMAQGSMQLQGEAQELALRERLVAAFPQDDIVDVPKGTAGADLLQTIGGKNAVDAGTIIWESKRTKGWSPGWISKLRDDQRATGAACAVLVSQALPKEIEHGFGLFDGVWVTSWTHATAVAAALRVGMIEVAEARQAALGRGEKMAELYSYLTGPDFKNRFQGIVEAFVEMRTDLEKEKVAIFRLWKVREGQITRALQNLAAVHGNLRGIAGRQIEYVPALALGAGEGEPPGAEREEENADAYDGAPPDRALVDFLFTLLPADGAAVGNRKIGERFVEAASARFRREATLDDYKRCRAVLLTTGRIRKGSGRGGSVARMPDDWSDEPNEQTDSTSASANGV